MNELANLLNSFDLTVLFQVSEKIARIVGTTLSPVILLVAIYIRLMETQIDGLTGGGKYGTALRDMILWSFVLGSYYSIGTLIFDFFNPIYAFLDSFGSLAATMDSFSKLMAKNKIDLDSKGMSIMGIISTPYALAANFIYYGTLVIVAFISAFLKIANVMAFGVAFIWGLIAIPMSISTTFKILKGWAYLLALALVWPIIQGLMMAMFAMLFTNAGDVLMGVTDTDPTLRAANIMTLFAVMHLLLAAVMISAPFVANALVTNSSAAAGIVMPFVAAASTAAMATIKGGKQGGGGGGGAGGGKMPGGGAAIEGAKQAFIKNNPTARAPAAASTPAATPAAASSPAATPAATSTPAATPAAASTPAATPAATSTPAATPAAASGGPVDFALKDKRVPPSTATGAGTPAATPDAAAAQAAARKQRRGAILGHQTKGVAKK